VSDFFVWDNFFFFLPRVLAALPVTLSIVGAATALALALGILLAFVRLENIPAAKTIARILVSFIRGTPIIVQMFLVYLNITRWDKIVFVYLAYGINSGAYFAEIFRSAIQSVPASQRDAARAMGLTRAQTYRRLLIPQAIPVAVPSLGTGMISLLQDTSLAFMLGIMDVIGRVRALGVLRARVLEGYAAAALVFAILSIGLEKTFGWLENRTAINRRGGDA